MVGLGRGGGGGRVEELKQDEKKVEALGFVRVRFGRGIICEKCRDGGRLCLEGFNKKT